MRNDDTIVAPATPPGRAGMSVIRLSGPQALAIASQVLRLRKRPLETRRAALASFADPEDGRILDEVVVICFRRPHSYTGEDVAEISCHGSPVILGYLVQCCLSSGARAAEPGEFTLRAFLNGRMDLSQAEAVRDLIESRTLYQARVAALQLAGSLSARLKPHQQSLLDLIAALEAGIDFGEDDVPIMGWKEAGRRLDEIYHDLSKLAESHRYGRMIREGITLALAGRPNVGKSSVFNRLLNRERAIVTAVPGTTRDLVSETEALDGIPLRFVDTAGIRNTQDEIERIGIERTRQAIADADLRLLIVDASDEWRSEDSELLQHTRRLGRMLLVANKCDLPMRTRPADLVKAVQGARSEGLGDVPMVFTSAKTGEGFEELKKQITASAGLGPGSGLEGEWLTNARHQQAIAGSLQALARAQQAARERVHHEMLLLDLYEALRRLGEITGTADVENILGVIFSKFCVGK